MNFFNEKPRTLSIKINVCENECNECLPAGKAGLHGFLDF